MLLLILLPVVSAQIVFQNDFNDDPVGTYTVSNLASDWNNPSWNDGVSEGRCSIVEGSDAYNGKSLMCRYPANTVDMNQWICRLGQDYDELYSSFYIKYKDPFEFRLGGKVPGMCGEACNSGGNIPDGTDGFGGIMMWRDDGRVVQYVYHPDQPGQWGDDMRWELGGQRYFEPGTWHRIENYIKINTPGQYDGIIKGWFDGELALERTGMRFRTVDTWAVNSFFFQTHFGGSGSEWEPKTDQYIYFDEFVVSTERLGDSLPTCDDVNGECCSSGQECDGSTESVIDCDTCCIGECQSPEQACSELDGNCCSANQVCSGNMQETYDCSDCCIGTCQDVQTCESAGYQCCTSCAQGAHTEYHNDCDGYCCEICFVHEADLNNDGCIDIIEMQSYINKWKMGTVEMIQLMSAISVWKEGC